MRKTILWTILALFCSGMMTTTVASGTSLDSGMLTEMSGGLVWTYVVCNGVVYVGGGSISYPAIPTTTEGDVTVPVSLGSLPVVGLNASAFHACAKITSVSIPAGVTSIGARAFRVCSSLKSVTIPESVESIGFNAFKGCTSLTSLRIPSAVASIGAQAFADCPALTNLTVSAESTHYQMIDGLLVETAGERTVVCPLSQALVGSLIIPGGITRIAEGAFYGLSGLTDITIPASVKKIGKDAFKGCDLDYVQVEGDNFIWLDGYGLYDCAEQQWIYLDQNAWVAKIVSTTVRASDPTIIDVTYKINLLGDTADVRVLAFLDGTTSFANAIRPETLVNNQDGTLSEMGPGVSLRAEHKFAWKVSTDYSGKLDKIMMQIFAKPQELLPLQLRTIPANGGNPAYEVSINTISDSDVMNALYWLYAEDASGLTLSGGVLWNGTTQLASGTKPTAAGAQYVFQKMGYAILDGTMLDYANANLRLGLSPCGTRQYGYKEK